MFRFFQIILLKYLVANSLVISMFANAPVPPALVVEIAPTRGSVLNTLCKGIARNKFMDESCIKTITCANAIHYIFIQKRRLVKYFHSFPAKTAIWTIFYHKCEFRSILLHLFYSSSKELVVRRSRLKCMKPLFLSSYHLPPPNIHNIFFKFCLSFSFGTNI